VTHEYPPNRAFDSVSISRVSALRDSDLTPRQRRFLATVMVHSGCFLERQYCEFTGTARGQNSREFVARLVARGFVRAIDQGPPDVDACTTSTTSRSTRRLAKRTTGTVVFARSAAWSNG
jgi:hypothetical protein